MISNVIFKFTYLWDMADFYPSIRLYVQDACDIEDQIKRLDVAIPILTDSLASAALEDDVEFFMLDDGQTKIQVKKRSVEQIMKSISSLETLKNYYINGLNGHVVRLLNHEDNRL